MRVVVLEHTGQLWDLEGDTNIYEIRVNIDTTYIQCLGFANLSLYVFFRFS